MRGAPTQRAVGLVGRGALRPVVSPEQRHWDPKVGENPKE